MTSTPEHILWSLEHACAMRQAKNWRDPEQTQRELGPLKEIATAQSEGREFRGVCLSSSTDDAEPLGFPTEEVCAAYGGGDIVRKTCSACTANVQPGSTHSSLANCFGRLWLNEDATVVDEIIEASLADCGMLSAMGTSCRETHPRWYGLWLRSPLPADLVAPLIRIVNRVAHVMCSTDNAMHLLTALEAALKHCLSLHVKLMPAGEVKQGKWLIPRHCPQCKTRRRELRGRCRVCDFVGASVAPRKRLARGRRPYMPLSRFLSDVQRVDIVDQFRRENNESTVVNHRDAFL